MLPIDYDLYYFIRVSDCDIVAEEPDDFSIVL